MPLQFLHMNYPCPLIQAMDVKKVGAGKQKRRYRVAGDFKRESEAGVGYEKGRAFNISYRQSAIADCTSCCPTGNIIDFSKSFRTYCRGRYSETIVRNDCSTVVTSNSNVATSNSTVVTSNSMVVTSDFAVTTSNSAVATSNSTVVTSNFAVATSNSTVATFYVTVPTVNIKNHLI